MIAQTVNNEVRDRALAMIDAELASLETIDLATTTSERHWLTRLSIRLSIPISDLLDRLWSRDVTRYRAADLIDSAQQAEINQYHERQRKKEAQKAKRKGRR